MTSYGRDGEIFEVNGIEFEAVEDRENRYRGFQCLSCKADFKHDPSDHVCEWGPDDGPANDDWIADAYESGACGNERYGNEQMCPVDTGIGMVGR